MKGLAVAQIIMLVLGIIVLAVIGYLLYTNFLGTSSSLSSNQCQSLAIDACRNAKLLSGSSWGGTVNLNLPLGCGVLLSNTKDTKDVPCNFGLGMKCYDYTAGTSTTPPTTAAATTSSSCNVLGIS